MKETLTWDLSVTLVAVSPRAVKMHVDRNIYILFILVVSTVHMYVLSKAGLFTIGKISHRNVYQQVNR